MVFDYKFWIGTSLIAMGAFTPIGMIVLKVNSDVSEIRATQIGIKETQKDHKNYVKESETSRNEAMIALTLIFEQNKTTNDKLDAIQSDVLGLKEDQHKRQRELYKFFKANPNLKDPTLNSELTLK